MRLSKLLMISTICICLTACVSSLILGNKAQSKLMWAFLKPLVGFDPNKVNFFETPMIKNRMVKLLGSKYEPTMKLLHTAQEIQQEGALFYVISRYAPPKYQEIADKAGMVWNADTNQMAVVLIQDGTPEIVSEQFENAKEKLTPVLPTELQTAYDYAVEKKKLAETLQNSIESSQDKIEAIPNLIKQKTEDTTTDTIEKTIEKTTEDIIK